MNTKNITEAIEQEHRAIRDEVAKLGNIFKTLPNDKEYKEWRMNLILLIRDFCNDLQKHFDLEEQGGFFDQLLKSAPNHHLQLEHLKDEHTDMIENLEKAMYILKTNEVYNKKVLEEIQDTVLKTVKILEEHEHAENELLEKIYLQDDGTGD